MNNERAAEPIRRDSSDPSGSESCGEAARWRGGEAALSQPAGGYLKSEDEKREII